VLLLISSDFPVLEKVKQEMKWNAGTAEQAQQLFENKNSSLL